MLCREPRLYSCQRIKEACIQKEIELDILDPNRMLLSLNNGQFELFYQERDNNGQCSDLIPLQHYDAVLPRFGVTSTESGCAVLRHFEAKNIPVLNSAVAISLARNKWESLQKLVAHNLPVPNSSFSAELVSTKSELQHSSFPLVVKLLQGSQGEGAMLFENIDNAESVLSTFKRLSENYLCQQYIAESRGTDIRAFVIGDKVVATMQRFSHRGEFRANLHLGGSAQQILLPEWEQQLAVQATKAIGLDVAGVDLIRSNNRTMILEVNASPGLEGIENATGNDIAIQLVEYLSIKH